MLCTWDEANGSFEVFGSKARTVSSQFERNYGTVSVLQAISYRYCSHRMQLALEAARVAHGDSDDRRARIGQHHRPSSAAAPRTFARRAAADASSGAFERTPAIFADKLDTALAQPPVSIISTGGRTSHFSHIHPTHSAARHAGMSVLFVLWSLGNHDLRREQ
jgi:hypothetical protein